MSTPTTLPFYELTINDNDDTGVSFNAMVDVPAHMKNFVAFGAKTTHYFEDEGKRMVLGVMISAGTPIYRNATDEAPEHNVIFKADTVRKIAKKFHLNQLGTAVNEMHDPTKVVQGVTMIESYTIGGDKNPSAPKVFEALNLQDGTWIAQYFVENDEVWNKVKSGEFRGFSVEGLFEMEPIEVKTEKMNKQKFSLKAWMFGDAEQPEVSAFAEITAADGMVLFYEGDLAAGTAIFIDAEGEQVPAPEGPYSVEIDEVAMIIVVDENGVIASVEAVEEEMTDEEMAAQVVTSGALRELFEAYTQTIDAKLSEIIATNESNAVTMAAQEKTITHLQEFSANKHNYVAMKAGKDTSNAPSGYRAILNKNKKS